MPSSPRFRTWYMIALVIGAALLWTVFASYGTIAAEWDDYRFEREMRMTEECTRETSGVIDCARLHVKRLMSMRSASEVLDLFAERIPPIRCHYVGHIIGQELYREHRDDERALRECSAVCESACAHGVVAEAFVSKAGLDDMQFDPAHLSVDELRKLGSLLCANGSCHGVGHAFFLAYGEFDPALAGCHEAAAGIRGIECTRGVFMEYSNILAARSAWYTAPDTVDIGSVFEVCTGVQRRSDREACYYYFPGMVLGAVQRQGGALREEEKILTMQKLCEAVPAKDRNMCVSGVGVHFYSYLLMSSPLARRICEGFTTLQEQASCAYGMLSMSLETGDIGQKFRYCAALADSSVRQSCYQSIFYVSGLRNKDVSAELYCGGSDECRAAAAHATENAFHYITRTVSE